MIYRRWIKSLLVIFMLLGISGTAKADLPDFHLELLADHQFSPQDKVKDSFGSRTGVETGLSYSLVDNLDLGASFVFGNNVGGRLFADLHTDRYARPASMFLQLRGIIHPAGTDNGLGAGAWYGMGVNAWHGRFLFGPAVEAYTAPGQSAWRNYSVLGLIGYQFDLGNRKTAPVLPPNAAPGLGTAVVKPVTPEPVPVPPAKKDPERLAWGHVLFSFDSAELNDNAKKVLTLASAWVAQNQNNIDEVRVDGGTCSMGSEEYNMKLSERRARAVADFMKANGVPESKMRVMWRGKANSPFPNDTKAGRRKNRRVDIDVFGSDEPGKTAERAAFIAD